VADPHITTKWNMVREGRKENRHFFNALHLHFITYTIPSSFFCQLSYLFSYDPINEEPALPPSLLFYFILILLGGGGFWQRNDFD
jgi:hypothetical protein